MRWLIVLILLLYSPPHAHADRPLSRQAFSPSTRTVRVMLVTDLTPFQKAQGFYMPNRSDWVSVNVIVEYLSSGRGPFILSDYHFGRSAVASLRRAVLAAARGIHYDARYLQVKLHLPIAPMFDLGIHIDGPSAGLAWAVAVASAILGDQLKDGICMTGVLGSSLKVGRVRGVEHKVEACRKSGGRHFIIPSGRQDFGVATKSMSLGVNLTEVGNLAEAYREATGRPLRRTSGMEK